MIFRVRRGVNVTKQAGGLIAVAQCAAAVDIIASGKGERKGNANLNGAVKLFVKITRLRDGLLFANKLFYDRIYVPLNVFLIFLIHNVPKVNV